MHRRQKVQKDNYQVSDINLTDMKSANCEVIQNTQQCTPATAERAEQKI